MANVPDKRTCGTMEVHERLLRTMPGYMEARAESENRAFQYANRSISASRTGVTVIPVVVHVVFKTAGQNISDAQIQSQIAVLNKDYRKTNPDVSSVPNPFKPLVADARIEFELAKKDPNGAATTGITRTQTNVDSFSDDNKVKSAATGGADAWDTTKYLNFWVCELGAGLLGYAQFPGGPKATDGVVILNSAFGTVGTAAGFSPYNLGRTASHEVGHWLNLRHIWGDDGNGCGGSDLVADTPNAAGPNFGKPAFPHVTCANGPNGDLFMNYMDYTDDAAMFMFSSGQVSRMQACLDGDRKTIGHTKAGPTVSIKDQIVTSFVADIQPTIFTSDVHPTIAAIDHSPTLFIIDSGIQNPNFPPQGPGPLFPGGPGPFTAIPFILATPHHSMAWTQSFPDLAQSRAASLLNQISQYEQVLKQYADAEVAGNLSAVDSVAAEQATALYTQLTNEYRQITGG